MILNYWGLVRAKEKNSERWVEGTYHRHVHMYKTLNDEKAEIYQEIISHLVIVDDVCRGSSKNISFFEVIPETISPYTGRKDKYGIKIFVHDIVRPNYFDGKYFEVLPCEGKSGLEWHLGAISNYWTGREVEIIGNTIDDPKMMENVPDDLNALQIFNSEINTQRTDEVILKMFYEAMAKK
jgi:hypothetical protein